MAAITATLKEAPKPSGKVIRYSGSGTANQSDTLSSAVCPEGAVQRLVCTICHYSGAVTQAGVTTSIDSGLGASFDATLNTGTANAQDTVYSPDEEIFLLPGDAIIVAAPQGGAGDIANIVIVLEQW
jgi:hypothetical protein